ncbi:MAG: KOW domain-containing RNA-binding protein [Oscillospiraceae bacterium]|nr:KOW domain-containing RNA-binding protein [Oscillospiraceae bacterium]
MEIKKGFAALSKAGRDKGRFFAVLSLEGNYALVADGDLRPLERPKRKNLRHLGATGHRFDPGELGSDKALRNAIKARFGGGNPSKEG